MKFEDVIIRPFEASDTVNLSNIWLEASLLAHPFIGERRLMEQKALIEEQYLPGAQTWVATLNGQAAGLSVCSTLSSAAYLFPRAIKASVSGVNSFRTR